MDWLIQLEQGALGISVFVIVRLIYHTFFIEG